MKEDNKHSSISIEKQPLEVPTSRNEAENNSVNDESAIAWNGDRRWWLGDKSQKPQRVPKDPDTPIIRTVINYPIRNNRHKSYRSKMLRKSTSRAMVLLRDPVDDDEESTGVKTNALIKGTLLEHRSVELKAQLRLVGNV
ncbi:hypothetical protein Tco_0831697 [Tanacetum coccineum]